MTVLEVRYIEFPTACYACGQPVQGFALHRRREDGMLEEATRIEIYPEHVESTEERVLSERQMRKLKGARRDA